MTIRTIRAPAAIAAVAALALTTEASRADDPPKKPDQHFTVDPVADITLTAGGAGLSALLELILSTGEVKPLPVQPGDSNRLLGVNRIAVTQTIDRNAGTFSDIGLATAVGFAVLDPFLSGYRDGWDATLVDAVMYAETIALTEGLTDVTKIAVRRPRPIDYLNCSTTASGLTGACSSTDLELSFFSGHAAITGAITGTATYLAFARSPGSPRPWITLAAGVLLTSFVGFERVRSGNHFPTDVIAGAGVGGAIGVLVPHLHRHSQEAPAVWVGLAPVEGGAALSVHGVLF